MGLFVKNLYCWAEYEAHSKRSNDDLFEVGARDRLRVW